MKMLIDGSKSGYNQYKQCLLEQNIQKIRGKYLKNSHTSNSFYNVNKSNESLNFMKNKI